VELRAGRRLTYVNVRCWERAIMVEIEGVWSVPAGWAYLYIGCQGIWHDKRMNVTDVHPVGRNPTALLKFPLNCSTYALSLSDVITPRGTR
jgi:hypothetical protein